MKDGAPPDKERKKTGQDGPSSRKDGSGEDWFDAKNGGTGEDIKAAGGKNETCLSGINFLPGVS